MENRWPADAFDGIVILGVDGEFEAEGTDGQEVIIQGEAGSPSDQCECRQAGRWLCVQPVKAQETTRVRLQLPKTKAWVVEMAAVRGEMRAAGFQARLHIGLGKGEIRVRDLSGVLSVKNGKGEVVVERFADSQVPDRPSLSETQGSAAGFDSAHRANRRGVSARDLLGVGVVGFRGWPAMWGWESFYMPWQEWISGAAYVTQLMPLWEKWGHFLAAGGKKLSVYLGKGTALIEGASTSNCYLTVAKGIVRMQGGRFGQLEAYVAHGGVECDSGLSARSAWSIDVRHGDIDISLPTDSEARLDAATRHGDIRSDFPLVRTSRPGPESQFGGRMVGVVGRGDSPSEVNLSVMHGNISIRAAAGARQRKQPREAATSGGSEPAAPAAQAPSGDSSSGADPRLAILESLSKGEITVEEAVRLLDRAS